MRIERIYDRKDLIDITTHTVLHNMVFGIVLILLLQWVFLGNLRSALIVGATIPFALFFAVIILVLRGESANLLSVGAIDFGLIVDATVIMVESIFRRLTQTTGAASAAHSFGCRGAFGQARRDLLGRGRREALDLLRGGHHHRRLPAAVHAQRRRRPHLRADGEDLCLCAGRRAARDLHGDAGDQRDPPARARAGDRDLGGARARTACTRRCCISRSPTQAAIMAGAGALCLLAALAIRSLGLEFLPKLEEGNLWIRATMPSTISLEEGNGYVNRMRVLIAGFPEVESVVSQHGRPDDGTDAAGFFNAEFFAPLRPAHQWRKGPRQGRSDREILHKLAAEFPGVEFNFSQYLQDNVAEAVSGVKGENSIKLFGNDLQTLTDTANKIKAVLATVQGITDLAVFTSLGQPTVQIDIDRAKAARYGLTPGTSTPPSAWASAAIGRRPL